MGPLAQPRAEVALIAASFKQARLLFGHAKAYLRPEWERHPRDWRVSDTSNIARLEYRPSGIVLTAHAAKADTMHGLAPSLALLDEPDKWEDNEADKMISAIVTGMGKLSGAKVIALGTYPTSDAHWFARWLAGEADYRQAHRAKAKDNPYSIATWRKANPSMDYLPPVAENLRKVAKAAKRSEDTLASFKSLNLNLGGPDTVEDVLLTEAQWRACEVDADDLPEASGMMVWSLDLSTSTAQSALSAHWPSTGRAEVVAFFPAEPSLAERGKRDGVGSVYERQYARGELMIAGDRIIDVALILAYGLERWGAPDAVVADDHRAKELVQEMDKAGIDAELVKRRMGFGDGAEDLRDFRRAVISGHLKVVVNLVLRASIAGAVTVSHGTTGATKLASKGDAVSRRQHHRDDAIAALHLGVAHGWRVMREQPYTSTHYTIE